jgi:hypothetical protein
MSGDMVLCQLKILDSRLEIFECSLRAITSRRTEAKCEFGLKRSKRKTLSNIPKQTLSAKSGNLHNSYRKRRNELLKASTFGEG